MRIVETGTPAFEKIMARLDARMGSGADAVEDIVRRIIRDVRRRGDKALLSLTNKFDAASFTTRSMRVSRAEFNRAEKSAKPEVVDALEKAAKRIEKFHEHQQESSWSIKENGAKLGQLVRPLARVGIYVPGGTASYPSSVLMNAIPARVARVPRVVMVTPSTDGKINPHTLMAAKIADVEEIYKIGGAQAVAALAYGTKTIEPVDKIVGPGNAYVAEAKRQVFGKVDIDMIAGPSEILVLADESADPELVAVDLLSQAEHDQNAYSILVTTSRALAQAVKPQLKKFLETMERKEIAKASVRRNCFALIAKDIESAFAIANRVAPEHLELMIKDAEKQVSRVVNAGAVFIGPWTPEPLGDYIAGPSHVLPTGGAARFGSPLGVGDFIKKTSTLCFTQKGFTAVAQSAGVIAREEGLTAHATAIDIRVKKKRRAGS